jgi:hypothetical protein
MSKIIIHFDGQIASEHTISMRTLGKSLSHLQSAIDRAYLDIKYGQIWKHARLRLNDYEETKFIAGLSQEGGYKFDFFANTEIAQKIVKRISVALRPAIDRAMESGDLQISNFTDSIDQRKQQIKSCILTPIDYIEFFQNPPEKVIRQYGDKSIGSSEFMVKNV